MNNGFWAQQRRVEPEDSKWTPGTCILQVLRSAVLTLSHIKCPGSCPGCASPGCLGTVARHQRLLKLLGGSDRWQHLGATQEVTIRRHCPEVTADGIG